MTINMCRDKGGRVEILRAININTVKTSKNKTDSFSNPSFEYLVDNFGGAVYKFCRSLTYSKEDADDLMQETFLKVFEQLPKISTYDNPQNFLFSTSLYIWKSWKRKYARRSRIAPIQSFSEISNDIALDDISVEDRFLAKDNARIVMGLIDSLPEKFKIPIILYYTMEMNVQEIAETLKWPSGTVRSRLHKARNLIKKGLIKVGYEE